MTQGDASRPRMRIAFVYDALVPWCTGGAERRFHELARRLAIRHDVHYLTWRWWGDDPVLVRDGITHHGVGTPRPFYGADGRRIVREQAAFAARIPASLARVRADVVDISATPFLPVYAAWLATRLTRTPLVATWHEYWGPHWLTYLGDRPRVARLAEAAERAARPLADRRVAVSTFTARRLRAGSAARAADEGEAEAGWRAATHVVPNGVDLESLAAAASTPPRERTADVLFVGRLIAEKRADLLVRAIAALAERQPAIRCDIVGDGPERDALVRLAQELGISANVRLLGRVPQAELPSRLASARLLAMPSAREGYGITVVEGQAAGAVPIVARSPLSAAPDLIDDGVDGLVVDGSVEAFAGAIAALLGDAGRLERLSRAAQATASRRGWDERTKEMEQVYASLVAAARRSEPDSRLPEAGVPGEARTWRAGT